jgi:hypothetical protein
MYPPEDGWERTQIFLDTANAGLREAGLEADIVSTGGSPNIPNIGKLKGATEHRSGTSIFNDRMQVAAGVATLEDCALNVYATVVSRAGPERGILDSGSKTLTSDTGGLDGHGYILEYPAARIAQFAEEHGFLDLAASNERPNVGEVVRIIPNHVCVVVNMVDRLITVRGDKLIGECRWRRAASSPDRGASLLDRGVCASGPVEPQFCRTFAPLITTLPLPLTSILPLPLMSMSLPWILIEPSFFMLISASPASSATRSPAVMENVFPTLTSTSFISDALSV